jgi:hypothetical protein
LGALYGVVRLPDESDAMYRIRIIYEVLKPKVNNVAVGQYLAYALGLAQVTIQNDDPSLHTGLGSDVYEPFRFFVHLQPSPGGGLPVSVASVSSILTAIKTWGTIWVLALTDAAQDSYPVSGVEVNNGIIVVPPAEDATAYEPQDARTATIVARFFEPVAALKNVLTTNVWKQGGLVISDLSDPDVILKGVAGTYESFVHSVIDEWKDLTDVWPGSDSYTTTSRVTTAVLLTLLTSDSYPTTARVSDPSGGALFTVRNEQKPPRWRVFRTNDSGTLLSTTFALLADAVPTPGMAWNGTVADPARFLVVRSSPAEHVWYSDASIPAGGAV